MSCIASRSTSSTGMATSGPPTCFRSSKDSCNEISDASRGSAHDDGRAGRTRSAADRPRRGGGGADRRRQWRERRRRAAPRARRPCAAAPARDRRFRLRPPEALASIALRARVLPCGCGRHVARAPRRVRGSGARRHLRARRHVFSRQAVVARGGARLLDADEAAHHEPVARDRCLRDDRWRPRLARDRPFPAHHVGLASRAAARARSTTCSTATSTS